MNTQYMGGKSNNWSMDESIKPLSNFIEMVPKMHITYLFIKTQIRKKSPNIRNKGYFFL